MSTQKQQVQKVVKQEASPTRATVKKHRIPFFFIVALIITIFIASRAIGLLKKKQAADAMNKAYANEIKELSEKERTMRAELDSFSTSTGIEQEIRQKFRVTKEGEELVVVVPEKKDPEAAEKENRGMFSFLKNIFK